MLHLAIAKGYSRIVQRLIQAGVDVDLTDPDSATALNLSLKVGDVEIMKALLEANAEVNDGTLHDAAHYLDTGAIELLIRHGHDPNMPSPRHGGRCPLAELCHQAPFFAPQANDTEMRRAIRALIDGGAQTDVKTITDNDKFERSLLLLALDSAKPDMMTAAFLHCDQWKHINEDFNLYTNGEYTFSPTMYVEKGIWRGDVAHRRKILNLLTTYKAKSRFWKNEGEQPRDMIDPPDHIARAEKERRSEIEKRERLERDLAYRLHLKEQEKQKEIEILEKEHAVVQRLEQDRHNTQYAALQARLNADLAHKQKQADIENQRDLRRVENVKAQKAIEYDTFKNMKSLEYRDREHAMRLMATEKSLIDSRNELGKTAIQVAQTEMQYKQAGLGAGSPRLALMDVSGTRGNRYLTDGSP